MVLKKNGQKVGNKENEFFLRKNGFLHALIGGAKNSLWRL